MNTTKISQIITPTEAVDLLNREAIKPAPTAIQGVPRLVRPRYLVLSIIALLAAGLAIAALSTAKELEVQLDEIHANLSRPGH